MAIETLAARRYTAGQIDGAIGAGASGVSLGKGHLLIHAEAANRTRRGV
jgi:hypothetical protein